MRLYIIRHADPDYPNNTISTYGHEEAKALGPRLAAENLDRIYSSPIARARHTMQYTADLVPVEPVIEDWTQEISLPAADMAEWGKHSVWNLPGEIIRGQAKNPTYDDWHELPHVKGHPIRERFEELKAASDAFTSR